MKTEPTKLLRVKQVAELTGMGVSTVWKYVKLGEFPEPFKLSMRVTVWSSDDVNDWIAKQLGRTS